jgi:hypothetical protein
MASRLAKGVAMSIPADRHQFIREINVNEHHTQYQYRYWERCFVKNNHAYLRAQIVIIQDHLGHAVTRQHIVDFYSRQEIESATKFIAAMMWGYEAPAGGRRAGYGPHRVLTMFLDPNAAIAAIGAVAIGNDTEITTSYNLLDRELNMCGPNFFTKHFYFLGKSMDGANPRLLIFDDRVANGLLQLFPYNHDFLNMLQIGAMRTPNAYIQYLNYASAQAEEIGCATDQIEYYLFHL